MISFAAGSASASVKFSASQVVIDNAVTATITFTAKDADIGAIDAIINYKEGVRNFESRN